MLLIEPMERPFDGLSIPLPRRALFPGFVNAHSHAFQRLIRYQTHEVPAERPRSDFWSWRRAMYDAALRLTPEDFKAVTARCYLDMLKAGITAVAEFHYVHHDRDGAPYADRNLLASKVIEAAEEVGIRVCVVPVAYHLSGFNRPALPEHRRFVSRNVDAFIRQVQDLRAAVGSLKNPSVGVGVAAHSVRAVPGTWLRRLKALADAEGIPLHIHASEQKGEVEACLEATGMRPVQWLETHGFLGEGTTIVHATHLHTREKIALGRAGVTICVCPTTERDLGDGLVDARGLLERGALLALGSDSHVVIDFFEEMRCLEGHERLRTRRRNVLVAPREAEHERADTLSVTPTLWSAATQGGSRALFMPLGCLEPGCRADAFTIDLDACELDGVSPREVDTALWLSGSYSWVRDVFVGGKRVIEAGRHPREDAIRAAFRALYR